MGEFDGWGLVQPAKLPSGSWGRWVCVNVFTDLTVGLPGPGLCSYSPQRPEAAKSLPQVPHRQAYFF